MAQLIGKIAQSAEKLTERAESEKRKSHTEILQSSENAATDFIENPTRSTDSGDDTTSALPQENRKPIPDQDATPQQP